MAVRAEVVLSDKGFVATTRCVVDLFVAFPSRTAAPAAPMQNTVKHTNDRILFISNQILAKLGNSGQAKYGKKRSLFAL